MPWFSENGPTPEQYQYETPVPRSTMPVSQPVPFTGPPLQPSAGIMAPTDPRMTGGWQPTSGQSTGTNPQQTIQAILAKYPPGSAGLQQAMPEIQKAFPGTRFDSSGGPVDEIVIPGYGLVDVLANAETGGNKSWTWQTGGGGGPMGAVGGVAGALGGVLGGGADYAARLPALEKTPGYQFRFTQGMKALEDSAASKGTLNTGGFAKDAMEYGQGLASTEFDNEYRRLFGLAGLGQGAQGAIGQYGSSYGDNATNLITGAGDARAAGTIGSGNAWQSALGGVGQTAMDAWMYNQMLRPQTPLPQGYATTAGPGWM